MKWNLLCVLLIAIGLFCITGCDEEYNTAKITPCETCGQQGDDDATTDDDDTEDDDDDVSDDDDDDDDSEPEYDDLYCDLPDPMGIAPNMIGGGAIDDTLTVYAFDENCEPIEGAFVLHDETTYQTDNEGKIEIAIAKAETDQRVTSWITGKGAVSYKANAQAMYFLHALKTDDWTDSDPGDFLSDDDPLGLTNPDISGALPIADIINATIYLGAAFPGFSRNTLFRYDFDHLLSQSTFAFNPGPFADPLDFPSSIYMPALSIEIGALSSTISGTNEQYTLPVNGLWTEQPIEGFVASVSLEEVLTESLLGEIINALIEGANITDIIIGLTSPLLTNGVSFEYAGAIPDWSGTGTPDIPVAAPDSTIDIDVANTAKSNDYVPVLLAEIPNRALVPLSIGMYTDQPVSMDATSIEAADYMAAVVNMDLENIFFASDDGLTFSLAAQYAEELEDWDGSVSFDADTDFLPWFDTTATGYEWQGPDAGKIFWDLANDGEADMYGVIFIPACENCPMVYATVPADESEFVVPYAELGITPSEDDVAAIIAGNLDGFDSNAFNPHTVFGEPISSLSLWTNYTITVSFGGE